MSGRLILKPHEEAALLYVHACLPQVDRETCIDMLETLKWDPEAVVAELGGSENIPKKFGGNENWPKIGEVQTLSSSRPKLERARTHSGEMNRTQKTFGDGNPVAYSSSSSSSGSSKDIGFRPRHSSSPSLRSTRSFPSSVTADRENENLPFLFEPIDGEDWQELSLDSKFIDSLTQLYPSHTGDDITGNRVIRIPPVLAFELYKLVLLNEAYRQNIESTDVFYDDANDDCSEGSSPSNHSDPEHDAQPVPISSLAQSNITKKKGKKGSKFSGGVYGDLNTWPGLTLSGHSTQLQTISSRSTTDVPSSDNQAGAVVVDDCDQETLTYSEYRNKAYYHLQKKNEFRDSLISVPKQTGSGAIMDYYRTEMRKHQRLMREANDKAKELILHQSEMSKKETILDLHNLFVQEAMTELQKFLQIWKTRLRDTGGKVTLKIITGRGNNSNGVARIRPAVISSLQARHISHVVLDGMVIVNLS